MLRALLLLALFGSLGGCAAMERQYVQDLDRSFTASPVNQRAYVQVALEPFRCQMAGARCRRDWGQATSDQLAVTLGRQGYRVFDSNEFHTYLDVGDGAGAPPALVQYPDLPPDIRADLLERSGVAAVLSGRITVGPPSDVTGYRDVHVSVRLSDARTGEMLWMAEHERTAFERKDVASEINSIVRFLAEAIERGAPLT